MAAVDFGVALSAAIEAFGDPDIVYEPAAPGSWPFVLRKGIFDRHHVFSRIGDDGVPVSLRMAALTIRFLDFPDGTLPVAGDRVTMPPALGGEYFDVVDVEPDGFGAAVLPMTLAT